MFLDKGDEVYGIGESVCTGFPGCLPGRRIAPERKDIFNVMLVVSLQNLHDIIPARFNTGEVRNH